MVGGRTWDGRVTGLGFLGSIVRCNQARMLDFVFHPLQTIKASCIFQRCCWALSMTLKGSHGIRTSCNVPGFARWGEWEVCAAPAPALDYIKPTRAVSAAHAPVVEYIEPAHAMIAAPAPVVEYIAPATAELAAPAPLVEHFARWSTSHQPHASSSCGVRKPRSTPRQIQIAARAPVVSCVTPTWTKLSLLQRSTKSENQAAVSALTAAPARTIGRFRLVR